MLVGIAALQAVALALLIPVPRIGGGYERDRDVAALTRVLAAVRANPRLRRIDWTNGAGRFLCPGFVDLHAHSALSSFGDPLQVPRIAQGFTTEVICPEERGSQLLVRQPAHPSSRQRRSSVAR